MTQHPRIEIRSLTEDDLEFIRVLRNANRQWFLNSEPISSAAHRRWYRKIASDRNVVFYVLWIAGRRAGTFSLTNRGDVVVVGNLLLARPYQGTGLMTAALRQMIEPNRTYRAEIKPDNGRSVSLFARLGFRPSQVVMTRSASSTPPVGSRGCPALAAMRSEHGGSI